MTLKQKKILFLLPCPFKHMYSVIKFCFPNFLQTPWEGKVKYYFKKQTSQYLFPLTHG